jgi:DNA ligase (NAD+)
MEAKDEIRRLREKLNEANYRYYVLDAPDMADYDYDMALRRLEELEAAHPELITPDSPTRRVGGEAISQFEKVTHQVPLESLQDVFSLAELWDFDARVREKEKSVEEREKRRAEARAAEEARQEQYKAAGQAKNKKK